MKFLNNDNLYFNASLFSDPSTGQPTIGSETYMIKITDRDLSTNIYNLYSGDFFYYSNNLKLHYDFLLRNIDFNLTNNTPVRYYLNFIGNVRVTLYDSFGTLLEELFVTLANVNNLYGIENELSYYVNGGDQTVLLDTSLNYVEMPRVLDDQLVMFINVWANHSIPHEYGTLTNAGYTYPNIDSPKTILIDATQEFILLERGLFLHRYKFELVCAPYALIWYDTAGFWQCLPFWGKQIYNYTHNELSNLNFATRKYLTLEERQWQLKSDFVKKWKTYLSLFYSNYVYLYVRDEQPAGHNRLLKVLVTDDNYQEVVKKQANKFDINIKLDKNLVIQ